MIDINKLKLTDMGNPELIPQLVEEMNTKFIKEEEKIICEKLFDLNIDKDILINQVQEINRLNDILREYKELEKQGLLVKLPCKVRSTVYLVDPRFATSRRKVMECYIDEYTVDKYGCYAVLSGNEPFYILKRFTAVNIIDFNKTVFLTKEEAEKALKEMECAE